MAQSSVWPNSVIEMHWLPISERPEFMHCPARQFIRVEGWRTHSGNTWMRTYHGVAFARPEGALDEMHGYRREDIERIMKEGDMDGVDEITHWMPARFPTVSGRREP